MRQNCGHSGSLKETYKVHCDKTTAFTMKTNLDQRRTPKKPKRFRSAFTTDQIDYLERQFKNFPYVNKAQRIQMACVLKIDERPVKIWFQNRRMKEKKENPKECNGETINDTQAFGINLSKNVPAIPSANDQCSFSLPILSTTEDIVNKHNDCKETNIVSQKHKMNAELAKLNIEQKLSHMKANYYKENTDQECLLPYFHSPRKNITTPLPITIDLRKKNLQSNDNTNNTSAEFSINLYKKYKQESAGIHTKVYDVDNHLQMNILPKEVHNDNNEKKKSKDMLELQQNLKSHVDNQGHIDLSTQKQDINHHKPEDVNVNKKPKLVYQPSLHTSLPVDSRNPAYQYYSVMPTIYTPPFMSSSGLLWKPVNLMPVIAANMPSIPTLHPQGPVYQQCNNCKCNDQGSSQHVPIQVSPNIQNPFAHYMFSVPYQHACP